MTAEVPVTTGLVLDASGFELLADDSRIGERRVLRPEDVAILRDIAARYAHAVRTRADMVTFLRLGHDLYTWLDGDAGQLGMLLSRTSHPAVFEVQAPRSPSAPARAVLMAPWELVADPSKDGFLAGDGLTGFSVARRLGRPLGEAPALDTFRLGVAFMASSPRGRNDLDYEAEEAAILSAIGASQLDLIVEETGDLARLGRQLAAVGGMPVVHLSCHGHNAWPFEGGVRAPALLLEDERGEEKPTSAEELVRTFRVRPRLTFVSACLTATVPDAPGRQPGGDTRPGVDRDIHAAPVTFPAADAAAPQDGSVLVAHSLATALVTAGVPAVLGWDGSVRDDSATLFAKHLYRELEAQTDLASAVAEARRALLASDAVSIRADWHLARLWLGPAGGGPLVGGSVKRSLARPDRGTRALLNHEQRQVAGRVVVDHRHEVRQALLTLDGRDKAGVLLQGPYQSGKSRLAARIVNRQSDYAVAVVSNDHTALAVLDAISNAVHAQPAARDLVAGRIQIVRNHPERLRDALTDLLTGPCAQLSGTARPLLLVIENLERILEPRPDGGHRVTAEFGPDLTAVLGAFDPMETDSRLLIVSRYLFDLDGLQNRLETIQLNPTSADGSAARAHFDRSAPPDRDRPADAVSGVVVPNQTSNTSLHLGNVDSPRLPGPGDGGQAPKKKQPLAALASGALAAGLLSGLAQYFAAGVRQVVPLLGFAALAILVGLAVTYAMLSVSRRKPVGPALALAVGLAVPLGAGGGVIGRQLGAPVAGPSLPVAGPSSSATGATCDNRVGEPGVVAVRALALPDRMSVCPVLLNNGLPITGPFAVTGQFIGRPELHPELVIVNSGDPTTCDALGNPTIPGLFYARGFVIQADGGWSFTDDLGYAEAVTIARNYQIVKAPPATIAAIVGDREAWIKLHPNDSNDYPGMAALPPDAKVIATFHQPPGTYAGKVVACKGS